MTNVFRDIDTFAVACDQPPSEANYKMYLDLIREEVGELEDAIADNDRIEQLDALIDILVVLFYCLGYMIVTSVDCFLLDL